MTTALLVVAVLLVLAHEFLASRRPGGRASWWLRPAVLVLLLVAVAAFAARAQLPARVEALVEPWLKRTPPPVAFDSLGDPLFTGALAAQTPERPFPSGGSREAVEEWQRHVIDRLRERTELSPASDGAVPVDVVSTEQVGDVQRTLLTFETWDGSRIPAYVHEPVEGRGGAAVLVVPGHGDGIRGTAGLVDDYQHAAALELARQGYITLTPELRGFGLLSPNGVGSHRAVAAAALEAGSFYKAIVVRDLVVALTVLQRWNGVDPDRLGVTGASLGGELAVFLGVLDERVRVVVSHSYAGSIGPTSISEQVTDEARQTPHGCHTIPGVNRLLWKEDWFRLLAPRPVLFVRGSRNVSPRVEEFAAAVGEAFAPFGASDRIQFLVEEGGHEFFVAPTVRFLDRWLPD
jgi:dienelactone hydrolase